MDNRQTLGWGSIRDPDFLGLTNVIARISHVRGPVEGLGVATTVLSLSLSLQEREMLTKTHWLHSGMPPNFCIAIRLSFAYCNIAGEVIVARPGQNSMTYEGLGVGGQSLLLKKKRLLWETDFYTPPVLGGAALSDNSAPAAHKIQRL